MSGNPGVGLLYFVLASVAVIALTYWVSRVLGTWQAVQTRGKRLRVLEGVPVGRDRQLFLVAVGNEVLVLGSSANSVSVVHRITDPETVAQYLAEQPIPAIRPNWSALQPNWSALQASLAKYVDKVRQLSGKRGLPQGAEATPQGVDATRPISAIEASIRKSLDRLHSLAIKAGKRNDG